MAEKPILDLRVPEDRHPDLAILVATWADSIAEWRSELGDVADAHVIWQPFPDGPSIGGILLHMIDAEAWWIQEFCGGEPVDRDHPATQYDLAMDHDNYGWPTPPAKPLTWYFDLMDTTHAAMLERIRSHNEPERLHVGQRRDATFRWVVAHLVEHDAYHGGQVVMLHEMAKKLAPISP